ncbi:MAG: hypothetical protein KF819_21780 [Labilithrix sp.]|nr:hypothetical protein [Labilithrix sp.]
MKRRFEYRLLAFVLGFVLTFCASASAWAKEARLAIVVGNNGSATLGRAELRYADDDAAKYAALFASNSQEQDVELLARFDADTTRLFPAQAKRAVAPTRAALEAAVGRIAARARAARERGDQVVFTFAFAGHGDVEEGRGFLELEDGRFFREDLEALLTRIPAVRAHVLLDACNSVYMLVARKPGGTRFTTPEEIERSMAARLAHVGTFVSTSADAQVYEWSRIESGVFSHSVRSGLSGAADLDGDGRVTYGELRAFVRIAAAGVPNARFRPRIYARGPGGKDDEVVFEPSAAGPGRKVALAAGAERRVTILDADEVPLIDVKLERGFGTNVFVPKVEDSGDTRAFTLVEQEDGHAERRVELAFSDDGQVGESDARAPLAARAAGRPFELLFAVAFGPRAVAQLPAERGGSDDVYGVSNEDGERMRRLLDAAAGNRRDLRILEGAGALAFGVTAVGAGIAAWVTPSDPDTRVTKDVVGGVFMGVGVLGLAASTQLFARSTMEERRDAYLLALRGKPEERELAVRDAEREIFEMEAVARRNRIGEGVFSFVFGALELGGAITLFVASDNPDLHWLGGGLVAASVGSIATGTGRLAVRSEEERLADLWRNERGTASPRSSKLRLDFGLGGISGTF